MDRNRAINRVVDGGYMSNCFVYGNSGFSAGTNLLLHINIIGRRKYCCFFLVLRAGISARMISTKACIAFAASAPSISSRIKQLGRSCIFPFPIEVVDSNFNVDDSIARMTRSVNAVSVRSSDPFTSIGR